MKYNAKTVFLYIICFFVVALIVIFIVTETEDGQDNYNRNTIFYSGEEQESITIIGKEESTEDFFNSVGTIEDITTMENTTYENWDIEVLIRTYFEAVRTCDVNLIKSIVDSKEAVSEDILKKKSEYIDDYTNFTYYLKTGLVDNTYILYVIYEVQLKEVETLAPAVERFYIKENSDGVVYISRLSLEGKYEDYLNEIEKTEEVVQMKNSVEERYYKACQTEEKLIELKDIINESIWMSE